MPGVSPWATGCMETRDWRPWPGTMPRAIRSACAPGRTSSPRIPAPRPRRSPASAGRSPSACARSIWGVTDRRCCRRTPRPPRRAAPSGSITAMPWGIATATASTSACTPTISTCSRTWGTPSTARGARSSTPGPPTPSATIRCWWATPACPTARAASSRCSTSGRRCVSCRPRPRRATRRATPTAARWRSSTCPMPIATCWTSSAPGAERTTACCTRGPHRPRPSRGLRCSPRPAAPSPAPRSGAASSRSTASAATCYSAVASVTCGMWSAAQDRWRPRTPWTGRRRTTGAVSGPATSRTCACTPSPPATRWRWAADSPPRTSPAISPACGRSSRASWAKTCRPSSSTSWSPTTGSPSSLRCGASRWSTTATRPPRPPWP